MTTGPSSAGKEVPLYRTGGTKTIFDELRLQLWAAQPGETLQWGNKTYGIHRLDGSRLIAKRGLETLSINLGDVY